MLHYLSIFLQVVLFFVAIALILVVLIQEPKNEGLTGQIGTTMASSFKGLAGREERLNQLTRNIGTAFMVLAAIVAVTAGRW